MNTPLFPPTAKEIPIQTSCKRNQREFVPGTVTGNLGKALTQANIAAFAQKILCALAGSLLALAANGAFATQLLINPGFETGNFDGWAVTGNSSSTGVGIDGTALTGADPIFTNFLNVRSGTYAGFALVKGLSAAEVIILTQTITVVPNSTYSVGFWLGIDSNAAFGVRLDDNHTQIFINDIGLLSGQQNVAPGSTAADFGEFSSSFNSGANTSVVVAFAIDASGSARINVSFDDLFVEEQAAAPEPATAFLLGLGLLGLGFSRRKKV